MTESKRYSVWLEDVPSENTLYPTNMKTGIRFLSKKGKNFKERATIAFHTLPKFPEKPLIVELVAYWRNMRRADMSNYHKAIGDALKSSGHIIDDYILLFRDQEYFYTDNPARTIEKGIQVFMLTIYEKEG
jgi:Holliday junction resolvase RusA-like endonuclease